MDRINTYSRKGTLVSLLALIAGLAPGAALALPEGLNVRGGSISVNQPDATTLVIQQGTQRAAGDWRSFNIGAGERVNIQQPSASSLMLARVTGGVGTEIFGQLNANGALLLLNPHGVLIGPGAVINTASFAAGTLNADPNQFMQGGALTLQPLAGAPADATVVNRGTISVSDAGLVALVAPQVINEGLIHARLGTIQLAAGTAATLDLSGDGLLQVALDPAASGALLNQGQLKAQVVRIGAAEAQALIHAAVNLDGLVEARGADDSGGTIVVASAGDVIVNGELNASGGAAASGGSVKLLGNRVALLDQALVNASGGSGGGEVLIGGNKLGQGPEPNASVAVMTAGSQVKADAQLQGDGGRVILWSDDYTGFYGTISARGGGNGGNGGFVETSSKQNLQAQGSVDAGAALGQGGLWLLDPANVTINTAASNNLNISGTNPELWAPTSGAATTTINAASLITALQTSDIKITSASTNTTGKGSITLTAALKTAASQTNQSTLTLEADDTNATNPGQNNINILGEIDMPYINLVVSKAASLASSINGKVNVRSFSSDASGTTTIGASLQNSGRGTGGLIAIKSQNIAINAPIKTVSGNVTIEASNDIQVNVNLSAIGSIDSAGDATLKAQHIALKGELDPSVPLEIKATGAINIEAAVANNLSGDAILSAGGALTIKGLLDGSTSSPTDFSDNLTVTSAANSVTFLNNVGSAAPLNAISLTSGQGSQFSGTTTVAPWTTDPISGPGTITINGAGGDVVFAGNLSVDSVVTPNPIQNYNIKFLGAVNSFTSATTLANGGIVFFGAAGTPTTTTFNGGLSLSNNTGATLAGTLFSAAQPLNFGTGAVTLAAASTIDTTNNGIAAGGETISFGGAVTGLGQSLTIKASSLSDPLDAKAVSFAGGINIGSLTVQPGNYKVAFTGATNTFDQPLDFQNKGLVTMGVANNSTNTFTFNNGVTFSGASAIQMGGIFNSPGKAQNFGLGNPTLVADTTLDTTTGNNPLGGDISFDGIKTGAYGLTINAGTNGNVVDNNIDGLTSLTLLNAKKLEIKGYASIGTFDIRDAGTDGVSIAGNATINKLLTAAKPYNLSFTGARNEFSKGSDVGGTRVEFNNTGNLTLGDSTGGDLFLFDDGFELNGTSGTGGPAQLFLGGTLTTSGEAIIADLPTKLLANSTIDTRNGGEIKIDGPIDATNAGTQMLSLDTTGAGGKVSLNGAIGSSTALGGLTVNSADQLSLGAAAVISTKGAIDLTATNGMETSATGSGATMASQGGAITLNSPLSLKADQTINSDGAAISFKGAVSGAGQTLTVDGGNGGSAIFTGNVSLKTLATTAKNYSVSLTGASNSFTDLVAFNNIGNLTLGDQSTDTFIFQAGPTFPGNQSALTLAGSFSTNGNGFSTGSPVTLAANTTIDATGASTGGAISLSGNINGNGNSLSLNSNNNGSASLSGTLSLKTLITAANNYSVSLTGSQNNFSDAVAFLNTGDITLGDAASDQFTFSAGLSTSGTGALNLAGVFATNGQAFNANNTGLVTLVQDTSINSANGAISFAGAVSGISKNLSIDGGNGGSATFKGGINIKDLITANNSYTVSFSGLQNTFADLIEFENSGTVTLGSNTGNHTFDFNGGLDLKGNAAIQIGGTINTAGTAQKFGSGSPTLLSSSTLNSTANGNADGANISLGGNLSGPNFDLTINAGKLGAISENTINLKSLTITSAKSLSVASNATLGDLITGTSAYSIAFNGSSNSFGASGNTPIKFDNKGSVSLGDNSADEFLFDTGFDLTNNVTALNLGSKILTSGDVIIAKAPITLLTTSSIDTTNKVGPTATGAAITIDGTINATTAGLETLSLTSGKAAITLNGAIGNNQALGAFSVADTAGTLTLAATADIIADGPVNLSASGGISSAADITTSGDAVTIGSAYTLTGDQTINSGGAAISFKGAVSGAGQVLSVDGGNGGSATFESTLNLKGLITAANNYSISLAGSSSLSDAVTFNNTGTLSLGDNAADTFAFTGGVIATAPSTINLNAAVTAAGTGLISLGDANTPLNVTGDSSVGGSSSGLISLGNASLADGITLTAGSGGAAPINLAAVSGSNGGASSNLTINSTGAVNVSGAIGTDISNVTIVNSGGISFANNVNISNLGIANTASYNISFSGSSNSFVNPVDFATSNLVSLGDAGDTFSFTGGFTFSRNAAASIAATINSSGAAINFGSGGVSLAGDSSVNTTTGNNPGGANISFGGKIDGSSRNLSLNAGSAGSISVAGFVNANTLTLTNAAPNSASFSDNVTLTDFITTNQPYSVSFTGSSNSFTNKVTFQNTGKISLGDASGSDEFSFNGGLSFSTIAAPVPPSATVLIGGKIYTSTATTPAAIEFSNRAIELISTSLLDTTNKNTNTDGGDINFASTLSGSAFNLSLNSGNAGSINGNGIDAAGAINLKDLTIANAKAANFSGNLTLSDLITTANPTKISLLGTSNTISKAVDFANSGTVTLGDDGTNTATPDSFRFLGGLSFSGNAASVLSGVIGSAGQAIDFGSGGVTLQASSRVDTTLNNSPAGAAVSFGAKVEGTTSLNEDLTVNAGSGSGSDVTFNGPVGSSSAGGVILGDVVVTTSGATTFTSDVTADSLFTDQPGSAILNGKIAVSPNIIGSGTGGVQINELNILINSAVEISSPRGPVVLSGNGGAINSAGNQANNLTITAGSNQDVSLNGTIGSINGILGDLAINTGGKTLINGNVLALSLVTDSAGTAELNGDIRVAGTKGVAINEAAILIQRDMEITSSQADILLSNAGGSINSEANEANDLTIKALNNKNISLNAAIGAGSNGSLGAINIETGGNTLLGSNIKALSLITDQPGTAELRGDISVTGSAGVQILENSLALNNTNNQAININSTTGEVVLSGAGGSISTPNQTGLTITAGNNKNVSLNAAIGSGSAPFGAIAINTGGHTLFASTVDALSLLTDKPGSAELQGNIATSGNAGVQILEQTLTINGQGSSNNRVEISSGGPVTLSSSGGAIDSPNQSDLAINAGTNDVTLNAAIGGNQQLGDIAINTGGATVFNSSVKAKSLVTDAPGTASLSGDINLSGPIGAQINEQTVTIKRSLTIDTSTGNGNVIFKGAIDSATGTNNNLTVKAGTGAISLDGPTGGNTLLGNLSLNGDSININAKTQASNIDMSAKTVINLNGDVISPGYLTPGVNYGYQAYSGPLTLLKDVTIEGNIGTINGTRVYTGKQDVGNFTLSRFYNSENKKADEPSRPDLPDSASNLLNNQLNGNAQGLNQAQALAGAGGPDSADVMGMADVPEQGQVCMELNDCQGD